MMAWIRITSLALIGGWLAQCLADTDSDVDASVSAYEAKRYDDALAALDAAQSRLGERPELSLNRGLILLAKGDREAAKRAFEHASEASDPQVAASGHYQLGNLAMDDESWDDAVSHYTAALKLEPDHQNAKWNLELAIQRQREPDSSSSSDSSSTSDESQSTSDGSSSSASDSSSTPSDSTASDDPSSTGESNTDSSGSPTGSDGSNGSDGSDGSGASTGTSNQGTNGADSSGAPPPDPSTSAPAPIDRADLDKALEQLDREDSFNFGAPGQNAVPVEKDW